MTITHKSLSNASSIPAELACTDADIFPEEDQLAAWTFVLPNEGNAGSRLFQECVRLHTSYDYLDRYGHHEVGDLHVLPSTQVQYGEDRMNIALM